MLTTQRREDQRSAKRAGLCREGGAGGHVELRVWSELEPPAVVIVVAGDPVEKDGLVRSAVVRIAHADDLVPRHAGRRGIAVIEVDEAVAREARIECDPQETLLA